MWACHDRPTVPVEITVERAGRTDVLTLIAVEATAQVDALAHFFWRPTVEISLDCFICCRTGRTMLVEQGYEAGRCMSAREHPQEIPPEVPSLSDTMFVHAAPLRIARFDWASAQTGCNTLRCTLSYWYAPFTDLKRQHPSARLNASPWTRLPYGLGCRACYDTGVEGALSLPTGSIQSNLVWPLVASCPTCQRSLVTFTTAPSITIIEPEPTAAGS
jgi:hypothetical protein